MSSIAEHLRRNAVRTPDREALVFGERVWTWAELDDDVDRIAGVLVDRGVRRGDRVAVMAPNGDGFIRVFFAVLRAGGILVPVNARLAPPEVRYILGDSGARTIVLGGGDAAAAVAADPELVDLEVLGLGPGRGDEDLLALAAARTAPPPSITVTESDDALILYTSGTTGDPKGVLLDHHRAIWAALSEIASLGMRDGDRYMHIAPLYHSGGVVYILTTVLLGGTNIVMPAFEPGAVLEALERHACTTFLGVPTMYQLLLAHPDLATRDLSSWTLGIFGAAPMPATTLSDLLGQLPSVALVQLCGQTEAGPGGIYATAEQVRRRPDVTGWQAMVFYESRVVRADGRDVSDGEVGEILLRGEGVMKGYWGRPDTTAQTLRDGWLHTGDLARLAEGGAMTLVDRLKDLIITGGRNVYSVEVERAVAQHADVADVAVIGRPHPTYGESIVAVVTPRDEANPSLEDIREQCRGQIADYKIPHALVVAEIPRNASGKVLKHVLRDLVGPPT